MLMYSGLTDSATSETSILPMSLTEWERSGETECNASRPVWSFMIGSCQGINGVILSLLIDSRFMRHKPAQHFIEPGQRPSVTNHSFAASPPRRGHRRRLSLDNSTGLETKNGCIWRLLRRTDHTMQGPVG